MTTDHRKWEKFEQLEEEKRLRILNAAMEEFAKQGYERASTVEIAKRAGISKGALFFYFGSKEELYRYLLDDAANVSLERMMAEYPYEERDLLELTRKVGEIKLRLSKVYPMIFDFLVSAFLEDPQQEYYRKKYADTMAEFTRRALSQIDASGLRDGISLPQALQMVYWVTEGIGHQALLQGEEGKFERMFEMFEQAPGTLRIMLYRES